MNKKVLIVEDDPESRKLLKVILKSRDYEVIEAEDGQAALTEAVKNLPALIFMDYRLPWIDGVDVTKLLKTKEATAKIPIIVVTAIVLPGDRERIIKDSGADDFISKPIDIKEVAALAKKYVGC